MDTTSLQKFTIPKIKRSFDKACHVRRLTSRREYTDVQNTLNGARLDIGCELTKYWKFGNAKLVTNSDLEKTFFLKRSEMREVGRHGRELEVNFCFLVLPHQSAMNICDHGLNTNNLPFKLLGNPLMGVYLFRYIDVALNYSQKHSIVNTTIVIFKVIFGKIKKVHVNKPSKMKAALDPTPNFDSHISKKAPTLSDPLEEQISNSLVYLYEYDMSFKSVVKPRHCLPYAVIPATVIEQKPIIVSSITPLKVQHKPLSLGKEKLMNCTVAKRIGKGKDATIIYENIQVRTPVVDTLSHTTNTISCLGDIVASNLCHDLGPVNEKIVSQEQDAFKTIEATCPFNKETAELEYVVSTSMVITSKSIKDPRLLKRTDKDISKPINPNLIAQLDPNILFKNDILCDIEKCVSVGELYPNLEENLKTNSLYLSFEEARIFHEQFRRKDKTLCYFVEPYNKTRQSKMECLQTKDDSEGSEILKQSSIYTQSYRHGIKQIENEKEEHPQAHNSLGKKQVCDKSKQLSLLNTLYEDVLQKQDSDHDAEHAQHVYSQTFGLSKNSSKMETSQKCEQQDYFDENNTSEMSPTRSQNRKNLCTRRSKSTHYLKKNNTSTYLDATPNHCTDINKINQTTISSEQKLSLHERHNACALFNREDTIKTENYLSKMDLIERESSDTSGKITGEPYTNICKIKDRSFLMAIEQYHEESTISKISTHSLEDKIACSKTNDLKALSCSHNYDKEESLKMTLKETYLPKEFDSITSVRQPDKKQTVPKNHLGCAKRRPDESQNALNDKKERVKNETRDKRTTSLQHQNSNIDTTQKKHTQKTPSSSETKMRDTVLGKEELFSPSHENGSLAICVTTKNCFSTMECKDDVSQFPTSEIKNVDDKDKIVNTNEVVPDVKNINLSKKYPNENNVLPVSLSKNDEVNIPCEIEKLSLEPIETKALLTSTKIGIHTSQVNELVTQDSENVDIKSLEDGMNQLSTISSDAYISNTCEELSDIQKLESQIDWYGLFGIDSHVTEHCKLSKSSHQLYFYKAKKQKELGGLRIFPDMQISIRNNVFDTLHTLELHDSLKKQTKHKFEKNNDESNDQVTQSPIKVVTQSPNSCEILQSSIEKVSIEAKDVHLAELFDSTRAEGTSQSDVKDDKSNGIDYTPRDSSETGHQTVYVTPENKQERLPIKKKRLSNKNLPKFVFKRSVGRIRKFSQSEENIKSVLNMLSDEATSCKSKRISKKLDRAILHLRKAHKRVQKSLQLVERRNSAKSPSAVGTSELEVNNTKHCPSEEITACKEVNIKTTQCDINVKKIASNICDSHSKIKPKKSVPADTKCLLLSMEDVNGLSKHNPQLTNAITLLPSLLCSSVMKDWPSNCSRNQLSVKDVSHLPDCKQSNKENTLPLSFSHVPDKNTTAELCVDPSVEVSVFHNTDLSEKDPLHASTVTNLTMDKKSYKDPLNQDEDISKTQYVPPKLESKSTSPLKQLSRLLRDADETDSLQSLHHCRLICKDMLPTFIHAFEKKQNCTFTDVIIDRKMLVKRNIHVSFKNVLRSCAIEALIELQMILETIQFIENRIHYLQKEQTFRSLLWYDSSLYTELIAGESGYQQQSHLYREFQKKLKRNALLTLQTHHTQICDVIQSIQEKNSSYYVFLKYRREIEECEAVLNNCCDHSEFSLSVPLSCGVHIGDTIGDLEKLQKNTFELIKNFAILPKCDPGKQEHALCLLEIISAKMNFIKSSEFIPMQLSLFGIEHLLFDAAKRLVLKQQSSYTGPQKASCITKDFMFSVNHYALSKLYELYGTPSEEMMPVQEKDGLSGAESLSKGVSFHPQHSVCYVGKIIDQARCAEPQLLKQMIHDCKQHLETLLKYFQILQECDANQIIITRRNLLESAEKEDQLKILLKPEAVETYIEIGMTYETLHFIMSLMASQKNKKRFRGLLYYDNSLFNDLIKSQHQMKSYLQGDIIAKAVDVIDHTISDIKTELEIISNFSESVNYTYALQIMTRELSELSELKNFTLNTKSEMNTYIHFSPFVASVHYGSMPSELDHNYNQFSELLDILMSAPKKDLGKMAHTIKVMKTIEMMKDAVFKKSAFEIIICQMETGSCNLDVTATDMNKNNPDQSPRKREKNCITWSDQEDELTAKKKKVINQQSTSTFVTEEQNILTATIRAKGDDANNKRSTNNDSQDSQGSENMDLESSNSEGQGTEEDSSYLHQGEHNICNEWSNHSLVPLNGSNNQFFSTSNPWYYSLYFWYQNGSNTDVVTESYQGVSHDMQQSIPYSGSPLFSMQNSYATNQSYSDIASQIQSSHLPTTGTLTTGMTYNYTTPSSSFLYDPTLRGAWSWGH
uniref:Uncharacterized protein n=1 Tax=Leptobrachium leishanense TaxID=445787 RepID=A0A8C5MSL9_9ANUR